MTWFETFIESFQGAVDKPITEKQFRVFEKYADNVSRTRYTITVLGKTEKYKYTAQEYNKGRYICFSVYVKKNNDKQIEVLKKEFKEIDKLLDTDISDEDFDRLENRQVEIQAEIARLDNEY